MAPREILRSSPNQSGIVTVVKTMMIDQGIMFELISEVVARFRVVTLCRTFSKPIDRATIRSLGLHGEEIRSTVAV